MALTLTEVLTSCVDLMDSPSQHMLQQMIQFASSKTDQDKLKLLAKVNSNFSALIKF